MVPAIHNIDNEDVVTRLTFDPSTREIEEEKSKQDGVPKSLEELERASISMVIQWQLEEDESDDERIRISNDMIDLSGFDILDEDDNKQVAKVDKTSHGFILDDVEELF